MEVNEKKGTCCHKCGHVHVKGTSCPKPFLKGDRSCARRVNELSTDNPGVSDLLATLEKHPNVYEKMGFDSIKGVEDYIESLNAQGWNDFKKEIEGELANIKEMHTMDHDAHDEHHQVRADVEEVTEYCTECLMEYLMEYEHKIEEAEYRGRKVKLGKPFLTPGGPKKRSVYVKNAKGNVVKVNFGDPNLKIKKSIPARRKAFRARHKCATAKDRTSPRYWSCRAW